MGLFDKIKNGLTKTRAQLQTQLEWMVKGKSLDEAAFDEIEEAVILADGGIEAAGDYRRRPKRTMEDGPDQDG